MNKNIKKLFQIKKELTKKRNYKKIDDESKLKLEKLGFKIKYDSDDNMYIYDIKNDEKMYTNAYLIEGIPYRKAENNYFSLEFTISNCHISNLALYEKNNGYKLVYKNRRK